jgi:CBS domain-containing protein
VLEICGCLSLTNRFYEVVRPSTSIAKTIRLLATRGVEHAAIVNDDGVLEAVVSVKDIAARIVKAFEEAGELERFDLKTLLETPVIEVASKPPLVVRLSDRRQCALIMAIRKIGFLPVVSDKGELSDACTELEYALYLLNDDRLAWCYASPNIVFGEPTEPLIESLGRMLELQFRRLPIKYSDEYYIVTMNTLLHAIVRESQTDVLLREALRYATLAPRLDYETTTVSVVAEIILASPEHAVLLVDESENPKAIITERDLVISYVDKINGVHLCHQKR